MISVFVEPESAYTARLAAAKPGSQATTHPVPVAQPPSLSADRAKEGYWTQILVETLQLDSNLPVLITTLVNSAVKWGDYGTNADREERKLELFKLIGRLIKEGRLRRYARNYVLLATDEELKRHQESLSKTVQPLVFPKPNV